MSTGAECRFDEVTPGQWTYWLQEWPYGDNPDGHTYGPFPGFERAYEHLHANHANPGGFNTNALPPDEHRHEWREGYAQVAVGVEVQIAIESLGVSPTKEAVLARLRTLPDDVGFRMWTRYAQREAVTCAGCHEVQAVSVVAK